MGRANGSQPSAKHIHPRVAVDAVLFTITQGALRTLLVKIKQGGFAGRWAFPGGLVQLDESLNAAAQRELYEKTGVQDLYLEQLYTFGSVTRDSAARTVSVAYFALIPPLVQTPHLGKKYVDIAWFPVHDLPELAHDHNAIAAYALQRLQSKLGYANIVYSLLPQEFTVAELQGGLRNYSRPSVGPPKFSAQAPQFRFAQASPENKAGRAPTGSTLFVLSAPAHAATCVVAVQPTRNSLGWGVICGRLRVSSVSSRAERIFDLCSSRCYLRSCLP